MQQKSKKILIVDDEPNIVLSLDYLVRKNGYIPFIARNGTEALILAMNEKPDLVLLDVMMPDVDGFEVCRQIRSNSDLADTKIIFLSAKSRREDIERGLAEGANSYITKPFSTKQIMQEIKKLIEIEPKN